MDLESITLGMRVYAEAGEDSDYGWVLEIDASRPDCVRVGWDSCQQSWCTADSLEEVAQ